MSGGELSGVDLARVALRAALETARKNGGNGRTAKAKPRMTPSVRHGGREPLGLGAAIGMLVNERAWELPAAGASLRERWEAIAPEFAGHVAAVGYDADSGRLTVCPESAAWATKLRLEQARVVQAANESAGRTVVRGLRILAPGSVPVSEPGAVAPAAAPNGPVKTRESASEGYRQALAAHQSVAPARRVDLGIAQAVERQNRAMRELSRRAFPEPVSSEEQPAPLDAVRVQRRRESEATRALALRRARAERAARQGSTAAGHLEGAAGAGELERTA
ncbi:DUF721 domain-containing protein [Streptomyces scabiei]|uniref:DUF721 domain-containing protein n=1 Tax=Streptomyces scabiei TaxID=1930 RepID=UPI001B32FD1A|nr:DUF721 domain-containing protein [Streptomyces sp. LBUM 1488]MBP5904599.1 DUF721 domain-containing protein [Streptomyces sp. LBUM 1488]